MTTFLTQSAQVGSVQSVPNDLASVELDTAVLTDPLKIAAYRDAIAQQLNDQSGGPKFMDLSERIGHVQIQTSAQGASILTVGIIDPLWVIPNATDGNGNPFIGVDESGYLWPPIDVNFPRGTDCVWRLCQLRMIWDADIGSDPNIILMFEDRIVALLREMSAAMPGGLAQGQPNQTLGGFIKQLVDNTNSVLKLTKGERIRLVELISPQDPNYILQVNDLPSSAQGQLRKNPLKRRRGLTAAQQKQIDAYAAVVAEMFGYPQQTFREAEAKAFGALNQGKAQQLAMRGTAIWSSYGPETP